MGRFLVFSKAGEKHARFRYHPLCKSVQLSHLCFADDLIMFCKGDKGSVELMIHAYELFSRASGLVMNKGKSNIYFNGISGGDSFPKRLSVMDQNRLVEKVVERIRGLGTRKLSYAGRLVLITSVWWIESKADHLWVKWVHAVYIKAKDWMSYEPTISSSWAWRKICQTKSILKPFITSGIASYSIRDGYRWLQPALANVRWAPWVGIKLMLPKHKFFAWLVSQQRLLTQDRLIKMQIISENQCYLCSLQEESHKHLFFECVYSSQCLCLISMWVGVQIPEQSVIQWWLRLRDRSLLKKQVIATVVCSLMYSIWDCRNKCRIENSLIRPEVLCRRLKSQISDRLRCINIVSKCRATTVWMEGLQ
ncbi:uncharacterized protein LOC141600681 [Silene latifolia]|uniref:uncharacterized protein LOC141600681 n=1 Tax=Silene latifolia TaxID=37657 RepID=UPI003D76E204